MPRTARVKSPNGIYHIMLRSISEVLLFREAKDKDQYLKLVKRYQQIYLFKILAYCLMTNHAHFIVDCNGADISKIMKSINQSYSLYFNKKYKRHGHIFQDRFKSKIVTDDRYLINLSIYIHNNPNDIQKSQKDLIEYKYSSLGFYIGTMDDELGLIEPKFILQKFSVKSEDSRQKYFNLIKKTWDGNTKIEIPIEFEGCEHRSERKILLRNFSSDDIIKAICKYSNIYFSENIKYNHLNTQMRSIYVVILRSLCNYKLKDMCNLFGNITASNVWNLCKKGTELLTTDEKYKSLIKEIIKEHSIAC